MAHRHGRRVHRERRQFFGALTAKVVAYVRYQCTLLVPQPHGGTVADAFAAYERAAGRPHPERPKAEPYPEGAEHLLAWFHDLQAGRPVSPAGVLPLPHAELAAYFTLIGVQPREWELTALRAMDSAYLEILGRPTA